MYGEMMNADDVGDPTITTKCVLDKDNGFLIVSDNGFAWKIVWGARQAMGPAWKMGQIGKSKWVRWHDVADVMPKKPGQVLVSLKIRKNGALVTDKKGVIKVKRWKLTIRANKGEPKATFKQRQPLFNQIMLDLFNQKKGEPDPPTSDSRI
ncbi:MAG: hypothetical protein ACFFCI_11500 [Promethearchaeota archaeon]